MDTNLCCVTGAFSYSGRFISKKLIDRGIPVRTLTNHLERAVDNLQIDVKPFDFDDQKRLTESLENVHTLFNTYWIRFAYKGLTHEKAYENTRRLIDAAKSAGVQKIIHTSILNARLESKYSYFHYKAKVEQYLQASDINYAILRPAVLFDENGILFNQIAWLLRHLPVFAIGGNGEYRISPIHVEDFADLALEARTWQENKIVDAIGPESPTFIDLVRLIEKAIGAHCILIKVPPSSIWIFAAILGKLKNDVILTKDEFWAMYEGLAYSDAPPTGQTKLSEWLNEHGKELGTKYLNEVKIHFK